MYVHQLMILINLLPWLVSVPSPMLFLSWVELLLLESSAFDRKIHPPEIMQALH